MRRSLAGLKPSLIRQIHALKKPESLDVSLGEPVLPVEPELWQRGLARFEKNPQGYTPNLGMPALREAIAGYHAIEGRQSGASVMVTVGSQEALFLLFFGLLDAGDEVVIMDPAYPAYAALATMCGADVVRVPLKPEHGYALFAADVEAALTPRTRLVVVSAPSNPLSRVDDARELAALARLAESRDFTVLSDEIYRELAFAVPPPSIATMTKRAVVVSGLSKSCAMTGHRLGYLIADEALVQALWPVHQMTVTCAGTLAQCLALEVFNEPRFLHAHRPHYVARWRAAKQALAAHGVPHIDAEGGFFTMCPVVPQGVDAFEFCKDFLARENVVAVPGTAFGPGGARHVRLSFAGEPEVFAEAVARLARFVKETRPAP